jgi:hypothetical protein
MTDEVRMKDLPMLAIDRERMQEQFEDFDEMTIEQFRLAAAERLASLAETVRMIDDNREDNA